MLNYLSLLFECLSIFLLLCLKRYYDDINITFWISSYTLMNQSSTAENNHNTKIKKNIKTIRHGH